jgi:hypothetical protein
MIGTTKMRRFGYENSWRDSFHVVLETQAGLTIEIRVRPRESHFPMVSVQGGQHVYLDERRDSVNTEFRSLEGKRDETSERRTASAHSFDAEVSSWRMRLTGKFKNCNEKGRPPG